MSQTSQSKITAFIFEGQTLSQTFPGPPCKLILKYIASRDLAACRLQPAHRPIWVNSE